MAWWRWHGRKRAPVALIFRWRRAHMFSFRLFFFLFASVVMHLAAFYVFEVVYPPNKKDLVRDAAIWLLPMDEPGVRAVLAGHGASLRAFSGGTGGLVEQAVPVVPLRFSFEEYQPRFEPLAPRELSAPLVFPEAVPVVLPDLEPVMEIEPGEGVAVVATPAQSAPLAWRVPTGETAAMALPEGMAERLGTCGGRRGMGIPGGLRPDGTRAGSRAGEWARRLAGWRGAAGNPGFQRA